MLHDALREQIAREFRFPFTPGQAAAADALSRFLMSPAGEAAFVLTGYAGTGKTSLIGAVVRVMKRIKRPVVLLAPTGRAAKVFSRHAGSQAYTIHKVIYRQKAFEGEASSYSLGYNKQKGALFIVDEASMISNNPTGNALFGTGMLLDDLIRYVYEAEGSKLLFVGDTAQLPPVGEDISPALCKTTLCHYGLRVSSAQLTEVVRQGRDSDVLSGATKLRQLLGEGSTGLPKVACAPKGEVRALPGGELIEALVSCYGDFGTDETIVVTRSNKRANVYNNGIRARIFDREGELVRGDMIMVVRNNYFWTEKLKIENKECKCPFDFVANGDIAEVVAVRNFQSLYGFRFADATLRFPDYEDFEMECRVLLDTLRSESPALTAEERQRLNDEVLADYADIPLKKERMRKLRQDPFYNALQIKYAYAITCHKAQGGQWARVFVDQGYMTEDMADTAYLRWLYTAFTRTSGLLYLVNFPKEQVLVSDDAG